MSLRPGNKTALSFLFFFCIFLVPLLGSDLLDDAAERENSGDLSGAVKLYDSWLDNNVGNSRYLEILFHGASLISDADQSISFLLAHSESLKGNDLKKVQGEVAKLYELSFKLSSAADYYLMASKSVDGSRDPSLYLKYLKLRYQCGEIPSDSEINSILLGPGSESLHVDALIFKAEVYKFKGKLDEAVNTLLNYPSGNLHPAIQLKLWEIFKLEKNSTEADRIYLYMKNQFPESIEFSMMNNSIGKIPRLSDYFQSGEDIDKPSAEEKVMCYIQTGVFVKEEYAQELKADLQNDGFKTIMISEGGKYKILVLGNESAESVLSKLRKKGYSGFSVNSPYDPD